MPDCRSGCGTAGAEAAAQLERLVAHLEGLARTAHGSWQLGRSATRGSCASARCWATTRARCAIAAGRSSTGSTARWRPWPARRPAIPTTSPCCVRTTSITQRASRRCSTRTPSGPRGARAFLVRHGPGHAPARRDMRGRAVARLPAPGRGRGLLHRAAGLLRSLDRPLLRPVRARWGIGGRDRGPAGQQLLRLDPDHHRARDLSRAPLAPGHAQGQPVRGSGASTRRRTSTRAGRCTQSGRCASEASSRSRCTCSSTSARACSGPRGSWSTPRSTWARCRSTRASSSCATGPRCRSRWPRVEVGRYCWWPTQASSYLTGCLEILAIRERYLAARGLAGVDPSDLPIEVLREFHDTLAGSGSLPLGLAERAVMATVG